jgi:hypothetical protein
VDRHDAHDGDLGVACAGHLGRSCQCPARWIAAVIRNQDSFHDWLLSGSSLMTNNQASG